MGSPATPPPPAEATLIRLVREASGLSPEAAAAKMEIKFSGSRWRQIERGFRADTQSKVIAPASTLAHMARVLGISADRLAETDREDAVALLRELERAKTTDAPPAEAAPLVELEEWQQQVILNALDEKPRSSQEKALLLRTLASKIEKAAQEEGGETSDDKTAGRSAS
ncbi:MAG TPA: helix-turn-helix transcriptional regulator [Candidatus Dormibacteraeota bacterium]|jgi:transcriptional regulator with XRE-family HTH domain